MKLSKKVFQVVQSKLSFVFHTFQNKNTLNNVPAQQRIFPRNKCKAKRFVDPLGYEEKQCQKKRRIQR